MTRKTFIIANVKAIHMTTTDNIYFNQCRSF